MWTVFLRQVGNKIWVSINVIKKLMCSKANRWFLHLVSEVTIKGTHQRLFRAGRAWKAVQAPHSSARGACPQKQPPVGREACGTRGILRGSGGSRPPSPSKEKKIPLTQNPRLAKLNTKRFQKFKREIPISLLPLGCCGCNLMEITRPLGSTRFRTGDLYWVPPGRWCGFLLSSSIK